MHFSKILSETTRPSAFIFGIKHHLGVFYQYCSNYAPGVKIDSSPGVTVLTRFLTKILVIRLVNGGRAGVS